MLDSQGRHITGCTEAAVWQARLGRRCAAVAFTRMPACRFPQTVLILPGTPAGSAKYTACLVGTKQKQGMKPEDSSDTLLNRLAQLELLVQVQKEEIRRISLERDLFAAWYDATRPSPARPASNVAEAETCPL